jgi:hypothetical protein
MTYNQVVTEIQEALESHKMLRDVMFGSPAAWLNRDYVPAFPSASFTIDSGQLNVGREQIFTIEVWLLDKSGIDGEFEQDVVSDMHGVAYDVLQTLRQQFHEYIISASVNWSAVSEKFEDYLSGVNFTFDLNVMRKYGACDVPNE